MNPTNCYTKEDIKGWLKPVLEKEDLKDYTLEIYSNPKDVDGYSGDITFVRVNGVCESDQKELHFVVKSGKRSKDLRDELPVRNAFENEIYFYETVLPALMKFQTEKKVKQPFNNAPKCYYTLLTDDTEVLILENMNESGYSLNNRRQPLNREHINAVISTYAKLHAISFGMRDQQPRLFNELTGKLQDVFRRVIEGAKNKENYNVYEQVISLAKSDKDTELIEMCNIWQEKSKTIADLTDPTDPYAVILHGDCWNNNFMFKPKDQKISPAGVCFLDFQLSRLGSPICDLSYFLFTCLSHEDVEDFDEINEVYYGNLSNTLREMGSDPQKVFPFEEFQNQWKKFSGFGMFMLPSVMKICLSDQEEIPDIIESAEDGSGISNVFSQHVKDTTAYRNRTIPIMKYVIKKKLIV